MQPELCFWFGGNSGPWSFCKPGIWKTKSHFGGLEGLICVKSRTFSVILFVFLLSFLLSSIPCAEGSHSKMENAGAAGSGSAGGPFVTVESSIPRGFPETGLKNYTGSSDFVLDSGAGGPGTTKQSSLPEARKKLSTDLLQLTDDSFLPPDMTREALIEQMESLNQITRADEQNISGNAVSANITSANAVYDDLYVEGDVEGEMDSGLQGADLVHVYVSFYPG